MSQPAADVEQVSRRIKVDPHAQVEVGLGHAADDRRQMKDRRGLGIDHVLDEGGIGDVPGEGRHARVRVSGRQDHIDEHQLLNRLVVTIRRAERPALQQGVGETTSQESTATGDDALHAGPAPQRTGRLPG